METICKTQWYVSVMDCTCINIFLHSCAPWKLKRNWVSCAGSPEEYPRHPYIQDDVNTEKDVLGPSRNFLEGFLCRGFIISKKKQTLRNGNRSFTFRFNSIISVSDWNTCQQYNTGGWKLAISHIPYMGNTTTSQHSGFPVFALLDDRKTHPAFLKADPTTSSTNFDKFGCFYVFFLMFLFVLSGADLGRQWGENNLKLQMFGHMILGEKNITSAICELFISMFWRNSRLKSTFHSSVSRFQKPTLERYPPGAEPESMLKERGESQTSTKDPRQCIFR